MREQSRIETRTHFVQPMGQRLMARDLDRQVSEFQVRVIRHGRSDQWRDMARS